MSRGKSDKIVYKEYNQSQQWLFPPRLDEDLRKSCSFKENGGKENGIWISTED